MTGFPFSRRAPGCWLVLCASLALAGCASHIPVSESIMFHDQRSNLKVRNGLGAGVSFVGSPTPGTAAKASPGFIGSGAYDEFPDDGIPLNPRRLGAMPFLVTHMDNSKVAIAFSAGIPVAGLDATVKLYGREYLTAAVSSPKQMQVYLQHRTFTSSSFGAALGPGLRSDTYFYDVASECMCRIETANMTSIGIRGIAVDKHELDLFTGIKLSVYAGYAPAIHQPFIEVGLTLGRM